MSDFNGTRKPYKKYFAYDFYIAGPLFTDAEKDYNLGLYTDLTIHGFKIFLPQLS